MDFVFFLLLLFFLGICSTIMNKQQRKVDKQEKQHCWLSKHTTQISGENKKKNILEKDRGADKQHLNRNLQLINIYICGNCLGIAKALAKD